MDESQDLNPKTARSSGNRGNDKWNSDERMPWPDWYFQESNRPQGSTLTNSMIYKLKTERTNHA